MKTKTEFPSLREVTASHQRAIKPETKNQNMKTPHRLVVRTKSSNRFHLKAEFETKAALDAASFAILRAHPDRFVCEISYIGK